MTGKDWMDECGKLNQTELERYVESIETLLSWEKFDKEWGWTGLNTLKIILQEELKGQKKLKEESDLARWEGGQRYSKRINKLMDDYGYTIWDTGGGCLAYGKRLAVGKNAYALITVIDDADIPVRWEDGVTIGLYDDEGSYDGVYWSFENMDELLDSKVWDAVENDGSYYTSVDQLVREVNK